MPNRLHGFFRTHNCSAETRLAQTPGSSEITVRMFHCLRFISYLPISNFSALMQPFQNRVGHKHPQCVPVSDEAVIP